MSGEAHQHRRVTRKQPRSKGQCATARRAAERKPWSRTAVSCSGRLVKVFAACALIAWGMPQPAVAETFDDAVFRALQEICGGNVQEEESDRISTSSAGGTLRRGRSRRPRLRRHRRRRRDRRSSGACRQFAKSEERRREVGATRAIYASYPRDAVLAENGQLQLPPAGGAGPEIVVGPAQGLSLFVSAGAFALNHHNNRFEDGYEAQLPTVTAGADYWLTPRLLAGMAFNYTNFDGTYDDGGGFDKDIFSPLLYATFLPFERAFVNAVLGYARSENPMTVTWSSLRSTRTLTPQGLGGRSQAIHPPTIPKICTRPDSSPATIIQSETSPSARASGSPSAIPRSAASGSTGTPGSSCAIRASIRPRCRAASARRRPSPLRSQTACCCRRPASPGCTSTPTTHATSMPVSSKRPIARSSLSSGERPARDWANIAVGASASFTNGLQPFVQFVTVQGNENYVSYGGTAGLRFSF